MKKALLALVLIPALAGCATIGPGYRGVKVQLGQIDRALLQPGIVGYNPLTDSVHETCVQQQTIDGEANPLTADQQPIHIQFKVQFSFLQEKVIDLFEKFNGDAYTTLVVPQVQEAFRSVVAQYKSDQATKSITEIKNQVLEQVRENTKGMVNIVDIPITHVDLPESLQKAIEMKQVVEQQALQKTYELDKAKKEAEITVANAQAQAQSIKLQTQALEKSPQLTQYKAVERWDGKLPNILLLDDKAPFLMNLGGK